MKVKDPAHDFWILGLAVLSVLKGEPWAVFNKRMQIVLHTNATENCFVSTFFFSFPLVVCYWSVTLYEAK